MDCVIMTRVPAAIQDHLCQMKRAIECFDREYFQDVRVWYDIDDMKIKYPYKA